MTVWVGSYMMDYGHVISSDSGLRPVINVITENGFTSGDGTDSSPYVITAE